MKKIFMILAVAASLIAVSACKNDKKDAAKEGEQTEAEAPKTGEASQEGEKAADAPAEAAPAAEQK